MAETKQDIHADIVAAFSALQNQFKEKYHAIKKRWKKGIAVINILRSRSKVACNWIVVGQG